MAWEIRRALILRFALSAVVCRPVVCRATVSRLLGDGRARTGTAASRWQTTPRRPSRSVAAPAAGHQPGQRRADVLGRAAAEAASQVNARPGRDPLSWVTAGCPRVATA